MYFTNEKINNLESLLSTKKLWKRTCTIGFFIFYFFKEALYFFPPMDLIPLDLYIVDLLWGLLRLQNWRAFVLCGSLMLPSYDEHYEPFLIKTLNQGLTHFFLICELLRK